MVLQDTADTTTRATETSKQGVFETGSKIAWDLLLSEQQQKQVMEVMDPVATLLLGPESPAVAQYEQALTSGSPEDIHAASLELLQAFGPYLEKGMGSLQQVSDRVHQIWDRLRQIHDEPGATPAADAPFQPGDARHLFEQVILPCFIKGSMETHAAEPPETNPVLKLLAVDPDREEAVVSALADLNARFTKGKEQDPQTAARNKQDFKAKASLTFNIIRGTLKVLNNDVRPLVEQILKDVAEHQAGEKESLSVVELANYAQQIIKTVRDALAEVKRVQEQLKAAGAPEEKIQEVETKAATEIGEQLLNSVPPDPGDNSGAE